MTERLPSRTPIGDNSTPRSAWNPKAAARKAARSEGRILETSTMADPDRYSGRPPKRGRGVWIVILMVAALALLAGGFSGFLG